MVCLITVAAHVGNEIDASLEKNGLSNQKMDGGNVWVYILMSETYRRYNDFVPDYLGECPHQVIIHCLER